NFLKFAGADEGKNSLDGPRTGLIHIQVLQAEVLQQFVNFLPIIRCKYLFQGIRPPLERGGGNLEEEWEFVVAKESASLGQRGNGLVLRSHDLASRPHFVQGLD